jgi:hypothetical protein
MPLPLLLAFADVAPALIPPPAPDVTRATVSVSGTVAPESSTYGTSTQGSGSSGARGSGSANVTFYPWVPLVDDESPRSLQAFLQRTSYVAVAAGGQYLTASYTPAANGGSYVQEYVPASASARLFVLPSLALLGAVGVNYLHDERTPVTGFATTHAIWEPWGTVGVDARAGDASLTLQWQFAGVDETATGTASTAPGFFLPRLSLGGRAVVDRRYDVTASVAVIPDGVEARAGFAAYPTRDLGLSLFAEVDHGQIYWNSTTDYDAIYGGPALTYWVSRRVELSLSYTPQWVSWSQGTEWEQTVTVGITARVP